MRAEEEEGGLVVHSTESSNKSVRFLFIAYSDETYVSKTFHISRISASGGKQSG